MFIDLSKIDEKGYDINETLSFGEEYIKNTAIKELDNVSVNGRIYYDVTREVVIDISVTGKMLLSDALTLEDVLYPFNISINEVVDESNEDFEKIPTNDAKLLDIMSFLWQNIVLEVPMRIVKDENRDIHLSGDGWELVDENTKKVDPRLAPLMALLDKEGKE